MSIRQSPAYIDKIANILGKFLEVIVVGFIPHCPMPNKRSIPGVRNVTWHILLIANLLSNNTRHVNDLMKLRRHRGSWVQSGKISVMVFDCRFNIWNFI